MTKVGDLRRVALVGERSSGRTSGPLPRLLVATGASLLVHPAIAESYATALAGSSSGSDDDAERSAWLSSAAVEGTELLRRFAAVSDGRGEQDRDHPVAVVLTLCAAAVLGGMGSFTAIAGWVADVPAEVLTRLYARPGARSRRRPRCGGCSPEPTRPRGGRRGRRLAARTGRQTSR